MLKKYKYKPSEIRYRNKMKIKHTYTKLLKLLRQLNNEYINEPVIQFYIKNCIKQLKEYEK